MNRFTTIALTIGGIVSVSLATIVAVYAFGGTSNDEMIITMIIAFTAPTITTLVALLKANENQTEIRETKIEVKQTNSDVQEISKKVDDLHDLTINYQALVNDG